MKWFKISISDTINHDKNYSFHRLIKIIPSEKNPSQSPEIKSEFQMFSRAQNKCPQILNASQNLLFSEKGTIKKIIMFDKKHDFMGKLWKLISTLLFCRLNNRVRLFAKSLLLPLLFFCFVDKDYLIKKDLNNLFSCLWLCHNNNVSRATTTKFCVEGKTRLKLIYCMINNGLDFSLFM